MDSGVKFDVEFESVLRFMLANTLKLKNRKNRKIFHFFRSKIYPMKNTQKNDTFLKKRKIFRVYFFQKNRPSKVIF